jgi:hypothetical protein
MGGARKLLFICFQQDCFLGHCHGQTANCLYLYHSSFSSLYLMQTSQTQYNFLSLNEDSSYRLTMQSNRI